MSCSSRFCDVILAALSSEAQGIANYYYVDLRRQKETKLSRMLDSVELRQAHSLARLVNTAGKPSDLVV